MRGEPLDEVHGMSAPYCQRYIERLQQATWTKLIHLILLAGDTSADMVADDRVHAGQEEVTSQTM
jgi:hypothetical protein